MDSSSATCFALVLLFSSLALVECQGLVAVKCGAQFPTTIFGQSSIYTGDGRIYVLGGVNSTGYSDSIYLYDVAADTLSRVGTLPTPTSGSAIAEDSQGNLYHFGGGDEVGLLDTINRFNTSTNGTWLVGRLPKAMTVLGAVQYKEDAVLLFGGFPTWDMLEVNLTTNQVTQVDGMVPSYASGIAWDGGDKVLLFHDKMQQIYSISGKNVTNFTTHEPHSFNLYHSVISTPKSAFIVGNDGYVAGRGNGIYEVDFQTLEFTFWEVDNYHAFPSGDFSFASTTYVPELHRLYMFGGTNSSSFNFRDIWYIDPPDRNEVTTTSLPTTTPPSPTFDCSNKTDGFYASPYACERYFGCRDGETFEYVCPPPFHFNPKLEVCDLPEVVNCDLDCSAKEDGLYPHSHYCQFYLRCLEGVGRVLECPSPLLFDRVEVKCNFPDLVNCTNQQQYGQNP